MENKENVLKDKSYAFALRIIKAYNHVATAKKDYVLSKQLLRSGTSRGANIAEANQAQSKLIFISKLGIALKEAVETDYWLNLLRDTGYLTAAQAKSLLLDCQELKAMLTAAIKTTKQRIKAKNSILNLQFLDFSSLHSKRLWQNVLLSPQFSILHSPFSIVDVLNSQFYCPPGRLTAVGGRGPVRGVADGGRSTVGRGLAGVTGDGVGVGFGVGVVRGLGDGFRFASALKLILKFVLIGIALKLKFESNPTLVFRLTLGMFVLMLFALVFAGRSPWSSQNSPAPHASTKIVPKIVRTMTLPVFGSCGGG